MKSIFHSGYELVSALHGEDTEEDKNGASGGTTVNNGGYNHAPWYSCYFSLASTVVGAGILGLPYAFSQTGWILGTIFLMLCASLSCFACHLMSEAALKTNIPSSYRTVTAASLPYYSKIIDLIVTFKGIGIATSYLIVIIDSVTLVFDAWSFPTILQNRFIILLLSYVIIVPVSSLPTLHAMKITTIISACMILFIIFLIFLYSLNITSISMLNPCTHANDSTCRGDYIYAQTDTWITLKTFPIFIFSFGCQQNTFSVVNELRRPNYFRINFIFIAALGTALFLSMVSCYAGYATYGSKVYSDILRNYPGKNKLSYFS
jgi:amino acid permease